MSAFDQRGQVVGVQHNSGRVGPMVYAVFSFSEGRDGWESELVAIYATAELAQDHADTENARYDDQPYRAEKFHVERWEVKTTRE